MKKIELIVVLCLMIFILSACQNADNTNQINKENYSQSQKSAKIDKDDWRLILVNQWNHIPNDYQVDTVTLKNGQSVDRRILNDLQDMMDACRNEGLSPLICSSYRTQEKQETLYNNKVKKYLNEGYSTHSAKEEAVKWVAIPGTSEHQLGLAVDIVSKDYQLLDKNQEATPEQKWLIANCYKYGFILRYPTEKTKLTGINYEPWHYRYVGKKAAKDITTRQISFEEYLNQS